MCQDIKALGLIPARSGSKSIKDKNIRLIGGKPLLAFSIEHSIKSKYIDRTIVSTDSNYYANVAIRYGAEVPFIRPSELAQDNSLDIDVTVHALEMLKKLDNYVPDCVVQLRPTCPIRDSQDIDKMIEILMNDNSADSIRSISAANEIPYKMWRVTDDGYLKPLLNDIEEGYNMPRQKLPPVYYQNASIDIVKTETVIKKRSMSGDYILPYVMEGFHDIDYNEDLIKAEICLLLKGTGHKFVVDIDGVIAQKRDDNNYSLSEPDYENIRKINELYDRGNYIVYFTSRGYKTGINWENETKKKLEMWGVKYNDLIFGKPDADIYIDDKALNIYELV